MSQINTIEKCNNEQSVLQLYSSLRDEVLNRRNIENQNLYHAKECVAKILDILNEKIKYSHDLENENDTLKDHIKTELEKRNELVNNIMESTELMNSNVEQANLLQNVIQICVSNKHNIENLKQEFISKFEKIINKKQNSCEEEILNSIDSYKSSNQINMQEILNKQQMLTNIQSEIQNLDETVNKLTEEKIIVEKENINICNKQLEVEKTVKEIHQQKDLEIADYKKKKFDLQEKSNSINNELCVLEKNNLEEEYNNKTAFWNSLMNVKNNLEETICINKTEYFNKENEVCVIEKILQQDMKISQDLINLKKEIEKKKYENNLIHDKHISLKQKLAELSIKENELDSQLRNYEEEFMKKENEVKINQDLLKEESNKFSNEVEALSKLLEEREQKEQLLNNEQQEITTKLSELNKCYEELVIKIETATKEEEEDEISINMKIDSTKNEINNQKCFNKKINTEIKNLFVKEKQIKSEFEEKYKKINLDFEERKNSLNEIYKNDSKSNTEDLKKIKDSKINLELQLSEYRVCNESLENELKLKIQQIEKLKDLKKSDKFVKKVDESEKVESTFKKPRNDSIPKYKVSPSIYSSTSDSSLENAKLAKRRKVTFKRRPRAKKTESSPKSAIQGPQKSINDVFEALKPSSKRTIRKPVF